MGLTDENSGSIPATMLVGPTSIGNGTYPYPVYQGGNNNGFGGDGWWVILLLLLVANGGWGNGYGGFGGGNQLGYDFPWLMNGQQGINNNVSDGFRDAQLHDSVTSVRDGISALSTQICGGFGDVSTQLCNGFNGVTNAVTGAQNALAQQLYTNQIADLNRSFDAQTAVTQGMNSLSMGLQNCCCENRAATADLKYTVATEACADRAAISEALRDVISANTASTQRILDQLCADKIEQKNDTINQLRSELMYARGQASQDVQTAAIQAGQRLLANEVEQYVAPRPIPAYTVQNPNCCYNSCGTNCSCGNF